MQLDLENVKKLVSKYRFKNDLANENKLNQNLDKIKNYLYKNGLVVSSRTTKYLGKLIEEVNQKLGISNELVKVFVYASPEIQAQCYLGSLDECVIRISSGIINLLSPEEMMFVYGHELGHFLLEHEGLHDENDFWKSQAQEISADRIGMIAAGSLDVSYRAIIKTVSGLGESHINFDISEYVSQMKKYLEVANLDNNQNTHPSMVLRLRALMWFSMSDAFKQFPNSETNISKVDLKVVSDFEKEKEILLQKEKVEYINELKFWIIAEVLFTKDSFSKIDQKRCQNLLGDKKLQNLISLFSNFSRQEINQKIKTMINDIKNSKNITIKEFNDVRNEIAQELRDKAA